MDQYKRIVICFDGTWNALTDPTAVTNVVRIGQAVKFSDDAGIKQVVYYNAGLVAAARSTASWGAFSVLGCAATCNGAWRS